MTDLFKPKSGKAQWEIVTEVLKTKDVGDIATYEELLEALGPGFPRASLNGVTWTAIKRFRMHKRTFENVRTIGFRMVEATEHSRLARKQQVRGGKRLADALDISKSTDTSNFDLNGKSAQRAEELHYRRLAEATARRVDRLDRRVGVVEKEQIVTDEKTDEVRHEIARMRETLRRHGIVDDE